MLDVVGFNYAESRYELDAELFPHRVIVGSETFPERIDVHVGAGPRLRTSSATSPGPAGTTSARPASGASTTRMPRATTPTGTSGPYP